MPTRRDVMTGAAALAAGAYLQPRKAWAGAEDQLTAAIKEKTNGAVPGKGRVSLSIPGIAENGLSVFTTVEVESPMTTDDHVKAIHLFAEKNPIAHVGSFRLGSRAGRAKVATNIRLAATQNVIALAEMSDGSFWFDQKNVIVTIAACIDGG